MNQMIGRRFRLVADFMAAFQGIRYRQIEVGALGQPLLFEYLALRWAKLYADVGRISPLPVECIQERLTVNLPLPPTRWEGRSDGARVVLRTGFYPLIEGRFDPEQVCLLAPSRAEADLLPRKAGYRVQVLSDVYSRENTAAMREIDSQLKTHRREVFMHHPVFAPGDFDLWLGLLAGAVVREVDAVNQVLDLAGAGCVVNISEHDLFGTTMALVAAHRKIPTVVVQHGIMGEYGYLPLKSSYMAAWGPESREWLEARGVPPSRVAITGSPRFDAVFSPPGMEPTTVKKTLGVPAKSRLVVLATSCVMAEDSQFLLQMALDGLMPLEGVFLVLHLHPREHRQYDPNQVYGPLLKGRVRAKMVPFGRVPFYDLLHSCDLLITATSTAGLEAMLCGKPVIVPTIPGREAVVPYVAGGGALGVSNAAELRREADRILNDPAYREQLAVRREAYLEQAHPGRGDAYDQLAGLIKKCMHT